MRNNKSKFNWKLPLFGAIGFTIGNAIADALWPNIKNAVIYAAGDSAEHIIVFTIVFAIAVAIMGAAGGASLGLALKNKRNALYLSCAGAIGFAAGFAAGYIFLSTIIGSPGNAIEYAIRDTVLFAIMGAIGGAALGLALKDKKKALYLLFSGAIGFAIVGVIGFAVIAVGGLALGLTLAYITKKEEKTNTPVLK